ncbi:MAG: pyridoxamine 5'-phosphate oxidase family protein [Pseudomonadota bacterium]
MQSWSKDLSPFNEAERLLQDRVGVRDRMEKVGRRVIYDLMPDEHRSFYERLPFLVVGGIDENYWSMPSILFGIPGFVHTPSARKMIINARLLEEDPLHKTLNEGDPIGVLGIQPITRRRNRMNGVVEERSNAAFSIKTVQAFGNCPQYIEARDFKVVGNLSLPESKGSDVFESLDFDIQNMIRRSYRFFVASQNDREDKLASGGVDVSHRGGLPGFIKVESNTLTIPDFRGNFAFSTLGNFSVNPSGGLLFLDDETQSIVQLWGSVELIMELTSELKQVPGAQRGWKFRVERGIRHKTASPLRWATGEIGPGSERSGIWPENMQLSKQPQ